LGFGFQVTAEWLRSDSLPDLIGREAEMDRFFAAFTDSVRKNQHFVMEGGAGSGKTVFVRHLLLRTLEL
jgi:tRNA A37 threonylcarbamoyladenosine biosynthesis protein TsaE